MRMFLLETAVLPKLTTAACAAIMGRSDAAAILDDLYHRNLFLIALDHDDPPPTPALSGAEGTDHRPPEIIGARWSTFGNQPTYRYHDLFRDFLLAHMERDAPEWRRGLHMRAAAAI